MKTKTVLITGGSSGIGQACVETFAKAGPKSSQKSSHEVWFTYRSGKERAIAIENQFEGNVKAFHFDQTQWDSLQKFISNLPSCPDILIHNAGLGSATVENYAKETHLQDQAMLQTNATGVLWLTQALLPQMKIRNSGKIIFMSSVGGGITQFPGFRLSDGMSKAAVAFLAKALSAELSQTGIDVFCICPGATETAMFEATMSKMSDADRTTLIARLPQQRLIRANEIANVALMLSKEEFTCLRGSVIDASMGLGVHPGLITGN